MAKRSGAFCWPLTAITAPRCDVMRSQQPLAATQPPPRKGGAIVRAAVPTAAAAPVKVAVAGIGAARRKRPRLAVGVDLAGDRDPRRNRCREQRRPAPGSRP